MPTAAELKGFEIRLTSPDPVLEFAAQELRAHLAVVAGDGGPGTITLSAGAGAGDSFECIVSLAGVVIAGSSSKGALNGAYWLLERLGFLWVRPGPAGTRFTPGLSLADGSYGDAPAFPTRTLILGNDALHDEWPAWFEWAARNRLNSIFLHDTPPSVLDRQPSARPAAADAIAADGRGWMFERWDADGALIRAAAARRGLLLQFGGHHLPGLLRRDLFERHPDWFPLRNGERDPRFNLCTSSPGAVAELRARAREFFARFAGAGIYHLWADDITGGGWCSCPSCAVLTPSDQALRATNALAEVLAESAPSARIAHLAYHDTIAPPTRQKPAANVTGLYAPRNRNYAFAIDDPACPRNSAEHLPELLGLRETFDRRDGALAVFEYYSDAILYKWLDPPNLTVLPADARAYRAAGVSDFGDLAVSPRPWLGPVWHAWWFARCAWDPHADIETELAGFCQACFESDGASFRALYRGLESAYRLLLDLGSLDRIPRHDVLDFSDRPPGALARKARQLEQAVALMAEAAAGLPARPAGLGSDTREDLAVQLAAARHLAARIGAWAAAVNDDPVSGRRLRETARAHLEELAGWDAAHSRPAYANLSRGMLRAARYHTDLVGRLLLP